MKEWEKGLLSHECVKFEGRTIEYISKELQLDRDVVLEAVKNNGHPIYYLPTKFENKEIILYAVKNGASLEFAFVELRNDRDFVLEAVKQDPKKWELDNGLS